MSTKKLQVIGLKGSGGSGIPEEQLKQIQDDIVKKLDRTGHAANVYLGTDADGNIIYKLEPTVTSTADSAFSLTSEFPVQNKVVTAKFNEISDKVKQLEENPVSSYDEIYIGSGDIPEGYTLQIDPEAEADEMIDEYARGQLSKLSETIDNLKQSGVGGDLTYGIYVGDTQPTNGVMYWLDTSEDSTTDEETGGDTGGGGTEENPDSGETEKTLSSISATYTGGNVIVGTVLTDLTGITVTATYSDGTSETVTDYTLSGEIVEGENTITVSYGGLTTTFAVTGVVESGGTVTYNIPEVASETWENSDANVNCNSHARDGYTAYKLTNVKQGDIITTAGVNSDGCPSWSEDGLTSTYNCASGVTAGICTKKSHDNYSWYQYTWTVDKDYETLYIASKTSWLEQYPNSVATWTTTN